MLAVSRTLYLSGGTVPSLEDYDKQRKIIQYISVEKNLNALIFTRKGFRSNMAMKNIFLVIEGKVEDTSVLGITNVLLLPSLSWQADRSERKYAFLQYMDPHMTIRPN